MLHDTLWRSNFDLAERCLTHPFVQALADGSLNADLFRSFIAQDAFFLRAFVKAYALALARTEEIEIIALCYELIGGALEELKLHRAYAAQLGIDIEHVFPNPACRAYTDFLLRTAWHTSLSETIAAMTPCMRLYAFLGGELVQKCGRNHPYRLWIQTYSGEEFGRLASRLEALLDRVGSDTTWVRDTYRYALRCELEFFSAALLFPSAAAM